MAISPTAEGFRAAFRRPSLTFAEISWRWVTGATAIAVLFFGLFEYLSTLPVTNGELLFLRSRQPYLMGEAIAHILRGSLWRGMLALLLAVMMLALLWMFTGSVGRIATVSGLLEYFREKFSGTLSSAVSDSATTGASSLQSLVRLNFLRVAATLAAVFGVVGAAILAGFVSTDAHPRPGLAFVLFVPLAGMIGWVWWSLNWLLSLAGVFAVRDGEDALGAISGAVTLCRERTGAVFAVSSWTGLAHMVAFVAVTTVVSIPMGFAPIVPWRLLVAVMILITVAYFALADWLYMARLAGYVCIAETPKALLKAPPIAPQPELPRTVPAPPLQTTIDRDERILSDIPNLAVES